MDSSNMANSGVDETPRVKFLCSFGGSILPRPQDGRLRYVGGETRIMSVPRDIDYDELVGRMRELYEDAAILKYQQPDEDLDALVSVVNDDDVVNMMEEYDKLGSGDAFTRLRIFLFSHPEHDASPHYMDVDERDTERRYVDALNSLSDSPDYRRQQLCDSPIISPADEAHIADQFFNSMNLEGSVHNQRNYEMGAPNYNLHKLACPNLGPGQLSTIVNQRFNEESQWNPAYYSPRYAGPQDTRTFAEFPSSPSATHYRVPFQEIPDRYIDRVPEDSHSQHINSHLPFEHHPQYAEQVTWSGYPGNILNAPTMGNEPSVCEHCKTAFQRNPSDFHYHVDQSAATNGLPQVISPCIECHPNMEAAAYNNDQGDPRPLYNDAQISERNRVLQNQLRANEPRAYPAEVGRIADHYTLDGTVRNIPISTGNLPDAHLFPATYVPHEEPRYVRAGAAELEGDVFHGQTATNGSHVRIPLEERGVCTTNLPYSYGADIPHQVLHGHSSQAMWRPAPTAVPVTSLYDTSTLQRRDSIPSGIVPINTVESSHRVYVGVDQSSWVEPSQRRFGNDGSAIPAQFPNLSPSTPFQEIEHTFTQDHLIRNPANLRPPELPSAILNDNPVSSANGSNLVQGEDTSSSEVRLDERTIHCGTGASSHSRKAECSDVDGARLLEQNENSERALYGASLKATNSKSTKSGEKSMGGAQPGQSITCSQEEIPELSFLPELIASAKKAKLESVEVVKAKAQEDVGGDRKAFVVNHASGNVANADETEPPETNGHSDGGSENGSEVSKIELTKAEEEAVSRGLQTIRNDDLEEIRELGSGTYGAVYYGKWKGSDVAIKRIKASCFAGRPSERERLIADFWKEALILSSLHHPNVVSFYGIVRDGPDGSLATVTEYMVNGSLKQYLRKKDRTIDRRKRLIIGMDAAFGMEYLHGKNIVHFDLKCENLLVNMRDPHRPVCKIGDLGLSKVKHQTLVSGGVRGTLPWMAPELLSGKSSMVTEKIDVYSFGIVMWELLTGEEPYSDRHCASIIGGIVNNTLRPQIPAWCDPEWKSLMESCWAADPSGRLSFSEISQKLRSMAAAMNVK